MTYGEACISEQHSMFLDKGIWKQGVVISNKPPRMSREEAAVYYTAKINKEFEKLGYCIKPKEDVESYPHVDLTGFDSVDDYYDYYEAQKFYKEMIA